MEYSDFMSKLDHARLDRDIDVCQLTVWKTFDYLYRNLS